MKMASNSDFMGAMTQAGPDDVAVGAEGAKGLASETDCVCCVVGGATVTSAMGALELATEVATGMAAWPADVAVD